MDNNILKSLKTLKKSRLGNDYWEYTYPEWSKGQLDFLECKGKKMLLRSCRRAGKSVALAEKLLKTANTPINLNGETIYPPCVYIAPTKADAKNIIWKELKKMCQKRGLAFVSHEVDLTLTFPHGGSIRLEGAGLASSAEKARGKKLGLVCIDEAAFINVLRELIGIWSPCLADYGGAIVLACTPGKSPSGFFYEADQGSQAEHWDRFYLDPEENPVFKGGKYEEFIQQQLTTLYGGNKDHPEFIREYKGLWVHDNSNLLIKYKSEWNDNNEDHIIDHKMFDYYIGLDLGFLDSTAITVAAVHKFEPWMEYVDEFSQTEMRIDDILKMVKKYSDIYDPETVIVDSGGFGKHTMEELKAREEFPAVASAYKYNKKLNIEMLNNDLAAKRVFINKKCVKLKEAWTKVLKTDDGKEDDKVDYGNKYVLDILDSSLYVHTESHPKVIEKIETPKTKEELMKEARFNRHKRKAAWESRYGVKGFFD